MTNSKIKTVIKVHTKKLKSYKCNMNPAWPVFWRTERLSVTELVQFLDNITDYEEFYYHLLKQREERCTGTRMTNAQVRNTCRHSYV